MKKLFPLPSPTSHFPRKCRGSVELTEPEAAASEAAGNSTREMSERLKLWRWPSLKTITITAEPLLEAGGVPAKLAGTARQSIVVRTVATAIFRMGFSLADLYATAIRDGDSGPR